MADIKDLIRPPFANYDVVVYFGAGLFTIPLAQRYLLTPLNLGLPHQLIIDTKSLSTQILTILTSLFIIYIIGHLVAYMSSQLIEKTLDRFLGKVSSAIQISAASTSANRNDAIRALINDRTDQIGADHSLFTAIVRGVFHIPLILHYYVMYKIGIFGYYDTRVPQSVIVALKKKYSEKLVPGENVSIRTKWYKPVEYFVINRCPDVVQRMYNYLVIAGLFRSLSFLFLLSAWALLYFSVHFFIHGDWLVMANFMGGGILTGFLEVFTVTSLSVFCMVSYVKFQRRYVEEVIMAFIFNKGAELPEPLI